MIGLLGEQISLEFFYLQLTITSVKTHQNISNCFDPIVQFNHQFVSETQS